MKTQILIIGLVITSLFMMSCEKDKSNNKSDVINPEKFKAVITGEIETEIEFDEQKIVAAGDLLSDNSSAYLSFTATDNDPFIVLNFYPPDDHPNKDDRISIQIKAKDVKPWTKNGTYNTVYFAQLQYVEEYAIVSYWDESERRDYISFNRPESMSRNVKVWREGSLFKGEMAERIGLQSHDNRLIYIILNFELRPGDDGLTD
ncbi:MAG: hypothetical protein PHW35_12685 [Lentimicrobiaceae bacterium]|mgnify:CR=1 FL=1|jgi:hypothetical protein|nr:hypothetical protein [Lentimicrobiaceae bacterium]MDD4598814.1 hypothetical protein [Lentimicrobiaceae bacterium]MDY0026766.1 hypothetical protein [Lentimicrobium sp.]